MLQNEGKILNQIQPNSATSIINMPSPSLPSRPPPKPLLSRINQNNRTLGIFFGCLSGMILGIVLVVQHQASIAIIGTPSSTVLQVFLVLLAMGTGGNLCSYIGACLDIITAERTLFDCIRWLYENYSRVDEGQKEERRQ